MIENREYLAFTRRIVRAFGRRAGADVDALPALRDLQTEIDQAMLRAVAACRGEGYSWAEIASRLGVTRQAAQQRYGRDELAQARRNDARRSVPCLTLSSTG